MIFEINGVPRKKNLFKKYRSFIRVDRDYIYIDLDGEEDNIPKKNVFNIYIQEPITEGVDSPTTVIEFYDEGEDNWFELEDATFPGLSEKMEIALQNEWKQFSEMKNLPDRVKWFNACCAVTYVTSGQDYGLFGGAVKTPESGVNHKETLFDSWGFECSKDLMNMLPSLYEGRSLRQFDDYKKNIDSYDESQKQMIKALGDKGLWSWDLGRLMLLCGLGYLCDYISYEDALSWCAKAGKKLQGIYGSWDEMIKGYLAGYCLWSGEDIKDTDTEAYDRIRAYDGLKKSKNNPFKIEWNLPLD